MSVPPITVGADVGFATLGGLERPLQGSEKHVAPIAIELSLASIAISLKRIADHLQYDKPGSHPNYPLYVSKNT